MALLDDLAKGGTPTGLAVGIGAALLTPVLLPAVSSVLRPAAKAVMRTGITLYRQTVEPLAAAVGNLVTEAQLELAASSGARAAEPETKASEDAAGQPQKRRSQRLGDAPSIPPGRA
ncbi:MAG TPA: hypothetical protein VE690_03980 [Rhodopila sp.]|nr:hypothetical protein [Rhodopila sp.]